MKYICVAAEKWIHNGFKEVISNRKKALFYFETDPDKEVRRREIIDNIWENDLWKLFKFDNKEDAQKLCDHVNKKYGDDFRPVEF